MVRSDLFRSLIAGEYGSALNADSPLESLPSEGTRIAVLATESALEAGFYQVRIKTSNREVIDSQQLCETNTLLIEKVKAEGFHDPDVQANWQNLLAEVETH